MTDKVVVGPDTLGVVESSDHDEVDDLLNAAFGRPDETELVHRLRADGDMWHEMTKRWEGVIAGYAALSRMRAPVGWACLAPVAVLPKYQNAAAAPDEAHRSHYAIGTRLVRDILTVVQFHGENQESPYDLPQTIVVLGKPSFYERAGFSSTRARRLISPYPIEHTLIARPGDDVPAETLIYPPAFDAL